MTSQSLTSVAVSTIFIYQCRRCMVVFKALLASFIASVFT